jgi:hypothetical protein
VLIWGWLFQTFVWLLSHPSPKEPVPMPPSTIQDLFAEATGDDVTVAADQTKLSTDTASDVAAHSGLTAAVIANGPTAFVQTDGTIIGLIPQPDGTLQDVVFKDGSVTPVPAPVPTPVPTPAPTPPTP